MNAPNKGPNSIDDYIAGFPPEVREKLEKVRAATRKGAPEAEEARAESPAGKRDR
jgi:uncharacterized protein YdhG (YjbR/CyaY superfamily)